MTTKTFGLLALLWLAACVASTPVARRDRDVAAEFAAAMAPHVADAGTMVAEATLDAAPAGPETVADGPVSATVTGHLGAAQTRDGSWLVQLPPTGGSVVAVSHGAMLNVRGTNTTDVHTATLALPAAVVPGDALVVAMPGSGRGDYWDVPGRSACTRMLAVVFVPYAVRSDLLRPPAIGNSWLSRFFRTVPIPESAVRLDRLPSVVDVQKLGVDWSSWGASEPTIPYLTALLRRFGGECYDGWSTDTRTPDQQHPGYGSYYASVVSPTGVQLCSTAPLEVKRPLALAVTQRGLDLVGAFADGRRQVALGGHCAGRKALVVLAGHLLGVDAFADPSSIVGPVWQEDLAYTPGAWWFGWSARWRYRVEPMAKTLADPPSMWGDVAAQQHDSLAWQVAGYMPQVVGSQIGTAHCMRLLGRTREWSPSADAMVQQWMSGPPAGADAQLRAAGIALPWGTDYSLSRGAGFCAAAWRHYQ